MASALLHSEGLKLTDLVFDVEWIIIILASCNNTSLVFNTCISYLIPKRHLKIFLHHIGYKALLTGSLRKNLHDNHS